MITKDKITVEIIRDILVHQLRVDNELLNPDNFYVLNQKFLIPPDDNLYFTISVDNQKVIGNSISKFNPVTNMEELSIEWVEPITIIVESKSINALKILPDVIMAMASQYAQQSMELNTLRIARVPLEIRNLCYVEGAARIFKFGLLFNVTSGAELTQNVSYYDSFSGELLTEQGKVDFVQN